MWPIIAKEIKQRKMSLLAFILGAVGFVWLYVAIFPSIQSQAQNYNKLLETMPKALLQAFGIESTGLQNIQSYLSTELYSLIWPLLIVFFVVSRAGSAIAGEIEKETMGSLLSQPISRTRIFFSKYLGAVLGLLIFGATTVLAAIPLAAAYGLSSKPINYFTLLGLGLLFGMVVYSFSLFVSAISSDRTKVYGITGGTLVVMYVFNIVAGLKSSLGWLKYSSLFHYFSANAALVHNRLNLAAVGLFILLTTIFTLAGMILFKNRDVSI